MRVPELAHLRLNVGTVGLDVALLKVSEVLPPLILLLQWTETQILPIFVLAGVVRVVLEKVLRVSGFEYL